MYLPDSAQEAVTAARALLQEGVLGPAGREIVVERRLAGEEVSVLAFCDGKSVVGMPPAQVREGGVVLQHHCAPISQCLAGGRAGPQASL